MRKERRNLNRTFSKALTLLLSVFMLLSSYTPVVTADDYSIQENKQVNKQAITLNSIFNSNPNNTKTNNNADGSDVTVDTWADLKSVIEGWSDATKRLTVRVNGTIAADSPITVTKNVKIIGENNAIIYGKKDAFFNQMFLVNGGTLTLGEGLTLSGKRTTTTSEICYTDNSNSNITYIKSQEEIKLDYNDSGLVYTPGFSGHTTGITLSNSAGNLAFKYYTPTELVLDSDSSNDAYDNLIHTFSIDQKKLFITVSDENQYTLGNGDYWIKNDESARQKANTPNNQDAELRKVIRDENGNITGFSDKAAESVTNGSEYIIFFISPYGQNQYLKNTGNNAVGITTNFNEAIIFTASAGDGSDDSNRPEHSTLFISNGNKGANFAGLFKPINDSNLDQIHIEVLSSATATSEVASMSAGNEYYLKAKDGDTVKFLKLNSVGSASWVSYDSSNDAAYKWKVIERDEVNILVNESISGKTQAVYKGTNGLEIRDLEEVTQEGVEGQLIINGDHIVKANLSGNYSDTNVFENGTSNIMVYKDADGRPEITSFEEGNATSGPFYFLGAKSGDKTYYLRYSTEKTNGHAEWVSEDNAGMGAWFKWYYSDGKLYSIATDTQKRTIVFDGTKAYITKYSTNTNEEGCRLGDPNNPTNIKWEATDYNHKKTELDTSNGYKGFFIKAINDATVNLEGAVLRDFNTVNGNDVPEKIAPVLIEGSKLNMSAGSIENNNVAYTADDNKSGDNGGGTDSHLKDKNPTRSAGAIIFTRGASNSEGPGSESLGNIYGAAEIKQNRGDAGAMIVQGGSYVTLGGARTSSNIDPKLSDCSIDTSLNGGKINQNLGFHYAGAVLVEDGATFRMVGSTSEMKYNATWNRGGAVWATDFGTNGDGKGADVPWRIKKLLNADQNRWKDLNGKANEGIFIMDAGTISENTAFKRGGAIDVESNSVYLNGGTISNNYCRERGGAIYVEGDSRSLVKRDNEGNIVYENGVDYFHDVYSYILNIKKGCIGDNYAVTYRGDSLSETVNFRGENKTNNQLNDLLDRVIADANAENPISDTSSSNKTANTGLIGPWGGRDYGGLGGGIWSCSATGLDLLNFADGNDVYIVNNHATGSANGAGRKIEGEIGTDLYIQNGTGQVVTGELNGQTWVNEVTGKPLSNNDLADDKMYFKNNTSGINANSVGGVDIYGNLSREGGAIALNGNVIFGKMTNTYQNSVQVEFSKKWGQGADKDAVSFKLYFEANDGSEVEVSNFTLDGIPTSEDQDADPSVLWQELNPSTQIRDKDTWLANLQIPSSMVYEGVEYVLYKLNHTTKGEIDPSTKEGNQKLIEAAHANPNGFSIVPGSVKLLVKEFDKNGALIDTVSFDQLQLKSVSAQTKEITDTVYQEGKACPVSSTQVTVNTSLTTFTMGAINDKASVEKYVNNEVHDTLYSFGDVIEYEIMAYVPMDAEEVIIYDTLETPLMFVNARGKEANNRIDQYVLQNGTDALNKEFRLPGDATNSGNVNIINNDVNPIYVIPTNNHIGNGNGSVKTLDNKTEVTNYSTKIADAPSNAKDVEMPEQNKNSGNTIYVKLNNEQITAANARGKWIVVRFNAAVKPSYRDIDKLKTIGWASELDPKQGTATSGEVLSLLDAYLETNNETIDKIRTKDNRYYVKSNKGNYYQVNIGSTLWYKTELLNGTTLRPIDGSDSFTHTPNCGLEGYYNVQAVFGEGQNASWNPAGTDLTAEEVGALRGGYNSPVINALQPHSGEKNQAQYFVKTKNNSKSNYKSNIVTVDVVSPEKYVNNKVHDDIEYFDEVFEYEIMVYVPDDAERVTVYDTLGDSLMFVDNSGARQYVLDGGGNLIGNSDISNDDETIRNELAGENPTKQDYTGIFNNWLWQNDSNNQQANRSMVNNGNINTYYSLEEVREKAVVLRRSNNANAPYVMKLDDQYYYSASGNNRGKVWRLLDPNNSSDNPWIVDYDKGINNQGSLTARVNNSNIQGVQGIEAHETTSRYQLVVHDDNNHKGNGEGTVIENGTPIEIKAGMVQIGNMNGNNYPNGFAANNLGNTIYLDITDTETLNQIRGKWLTLKYDAAIKPSYFKQVAEKVASGNTDDDASINWEKISNDGYIQEPATLTNGSHAGLANTANYIVVDRKGNHNSSTNTVTVTPELIDIEVSKEWVVEQGYNGIPTVEDFKNKLKLYWDKSNDEFDNVDSEITSNYSDKLTVDTNNDQYDTGTGSYNWTIKWTNLPKLREYYVIENGVAGFKQPIYTNASNDDTSKAFDEGTITNEENKNKLDYEVHALKNLIGKDLTAGKFNFEIFDIIDQQGNHYNANGEITNSASVSIIKPNEADGSINFGNISLPNTVNKEYTIKIREIKPNPLPDDLKYVDFDTSVKEIKVKVIKDKDSLVDELKTARIYLKNNEVTQYQYEDNGGNVTIVEPIYRGNNLVSSGYDVFIKDDSGILVAGWKHSNTFKNSVTVYLTEGIYTIYTIDSNNDIRAREFRVDRVNGKLDIAKKKLTEEVNPKNGDAVGYIWYGSRYWYNLINVSQYQYEGEPVLIPLSTDATFENKVETTSVTVNKTWDNRGDEDAKLPDRLQVDLYYKVEGETDNKIRKVSIVGVNPQYLSQDNNWSFTWEDLPIKENGKVITYYVKETAPKDWKPVGNWKENGIVANSPISSSGIHLDETNPWTTIANSMLYSSDNSVVTKIIVEGKLYYLDEYGKLASTEVNSQKAKQLEEEDYERLLWRAHDYGVTNSQRISIKFQSVKDKNMWLHGQETSTYPYTGTVSVMSGKSNATTFYLVVSGSKTNAMFFWKGNSYVYYVNGNLSNTECGYHEVIFQKPNTYETFESTHTIEMTNEYYPSYNLPNSGGIGTYIFTIAGFAFLTLAFEKLFGFKKIR